MSDADLRLEYFTTLQVQENNPTFRMVSADDGNYWEILARLEINLKGLKSLNIYFKYEEECAYLYQKILNVLNSNAKIFSIEDYAEDLKDTYITHD